MQRIAEVALPVEERVRSYREFILTLKDDTYQESRSCALLGDLKYLKGQSTKAKFKIDGGKCHLTGTHSSGMTTEEVWERVERK